MTETLAQLFDLTNNSLILLFAIFARIGGVMVGAPVFGEQMLPARVRLAIALAFTFVTAPLLAQDLAPIVATGQLLGPHLLGEFGAGLALGLLLRLFVLVLHVAGAIIAQSTSLSAMFGGSAGEPQPAVGTLLTLAALAFAAMMGLHVKLAQAIVLSYDFMPAGGLPSAEDLRAWSVAGVSRGFALAFSISAPFLIAALIYNVALGAINRALPQLMVSMIGAPALTAAGLVMLAIILPVAVTLWHQNLVAFLLDPAGGFQ